MHGTLEMARKNRKSRLVTRREPNGRIAREDDGPSPVQVRRLRDAALRGVSDPEWGTELGRYFLDGTITSSMYAAGKWWAQVAANYRATIGAPPNKSPAIERGSRTCPPDVDSVEGQKITERDSRTAMEFNAALAALRDGGLVAMRVVRSLCENDESPTGYQEIEYLKVGLLRLAEWRDLTRRPKSVHSVR